MSTYSMYLYDVQTLTDELEINPGQSLSDVQTLTDTFSYVCEYQLQDIQTLIESYTFTNLTNRTLQDIQTLQDSFVGYKTSIGSIQTPIPPIVAPGQNSPPSPESPPGPGLGPFSPGVLRYQEVTVNFSSSIGSITVKAPDFNNQDTVQPKVVNEDTRGLQLIQYVDPIWPDYIAYSLSFSQLDYSEVQVFREFLRLSVGLPITYTDVFGNEHTGFIPDPDQPATSADTGYSIKITFLQGIPA